MSAIIDYKNVEVLRKELLVLKNVNFQLEEGQFVYLIGRVGSGKSSLMKTMYAEVPIEMGEARIFGLRPVCHPPQGRAYAATADWCGVPGFPAVV